MSNHYTKKEVLEMFKNNSTGCQEIGECNSCAFHKPTHCKLIKILEDLDLINYDDEGTSSMECFTIGVRKWLKLEKIKEIMK